MFDGIAYRHTCLRDIMRLQDAAGSCSHVDCTVEKPAFQVRIARMQAHIAKFLAIKCRSPNAGHELHPPLDCWGGHDNDDFAVSVCVCPGVCLRVCLCVPCLSLCVRVCLCLCVCHLLILTSSHLHIFSYSHLLITSLHLHILTSSHLVIFTSEASVSSCHLHICIKASVCKSFCV